MLNISCSTVAVLGIPFHNVTMDEAVALIEEQIREGGFHQVATANVDFLRHSMRDRDLRNIICSCEMIVPDGMPVVWISRLIGTPLKERVTGIDLVERLAAVSARRGYGIFLLGASESRSQRAAKVLKQRYPDLRIVGRYSPEPQPLEEMDHEEILRRIEEAKPDILLVAFGNPKQEQWLAMHRDRAQDVKAIVERLKAQKRPEAVRHNRDYRPWGHYEVLTLGDRFQVKRIVCKPGEKLSLQKHFHRAEHWVVVEGSAIVTRDHEEILVRENESIYLPLGCVHRLYNPGRIPLTLIEVQSGPYLGEDDIIRIEDTYGRG